MYLYRWSYKIHCHDWSKISLILNLKIKAQQQLTADIIERYKNEKITNPEFFRNVVHDVSLALKWSDKYCILFQSKQPGMHVFRIFPELMKF